MNVRKVAIIAERALIEAPKWAPLATGHPEWALASKPLGDAVETFIRAGVAKSNRFDFYDKHLIMYANKFNLITQSTKAFLELVGEFPRYMRRECSKAMSIF